MKRSDLLDTLKKVSPALASRAVMPVLSHLCFEAGQAYAYDNVVCLRTKAPADLTKLEGAVPGDLLLSMLGASTVEDAGVEITKKELLIKLGRAKVRLPVLPTTDFLFREPKREGVSVALDVSLRAALGLALRACGDEVQSVTANSVTLSFGKRKLTIYATNASVLVCASVAVQPSELEGKTVVLSERFCRLLLKATDTNVNLILTPDSDLLAVGDEMELFGHVLKNTGAAQFENVVKAANQEKIPKADIPALLKRCLDRAALVNPEIVKLTYADGKLVLFGEGQGSELHDSVKLALGKQEVGVLTCPGDVLMFLDVAKRIGISERVVCLGADNFFALVGVKRG